MAPGYSTLRIGRHNVWCLCTPAPDEHEQQERSMRHAVAEAFIQRECGEQCVTTPYRPTTLNGSPVEVETIITVIYTLNQ